jgi:hypothetical protein
MPSGNATDRTADLAASVAALEDLRRALVPLAAMADKFENPLRALSAATFGLDGPATVDVQATRHRAAEPPMDNGPPGAGEVVDPDQPFDRPPLREPSDRDAAQEQSIALKELARHAADIHALLRRITERDRAAVFAGPPLND